MVRWGQKPPEATFLHWVSSESGEPEKNSLGNSWTCNLLDTTEAGHRSSSFHSNSMDADKCIWYWTSSFKRSIQCVKTTCFFSGDRALVSNFWMWSLSQHQQVRGIYWKILGLIPWVVVHYWYGKCSAWLYVSLFTCIASWGPKKLQGYPQSLTESTCWQLLCPTVQDI